MEKNILVEEAIEGFGFTGKLLSYERYGSGHINDTFLLSYDVNGMGRIRIILQRMSKALTPESELLMDNIVRVTEHLEKKIVAFGGDPYREALRVIKTPLGKSCYVDSDGECWRAYPFVEGATSYDQVKDEADFYQSGVSFGNFQGMLSDFDAASLHETIPGFHDTKKRYAKFEAVVNANPLDRVKEAMEEIEFVKSRSDLKDVLGDALTSGILPLRVTHNDTKLNNILIDDKSGEGICVIDLDTVMPGLSVNDFGDSIRFGANTALEDEKDLSKVSLDLHLFEVYVEGFLAGCKGALSEAEIDYLPLGAKVMTYECGVRFLTDFIEGDVYFHVARYGHNLDRARTQFALIKDMEAKWDKMLEIVSKHKKR